MTDPEEHETPKPENSDAVRQAPADVADDDDADVFSETAEITPQDGPPTP
jgi:hypothetical protein